MFFQKCQITFQCAVCGTEKERLVFPPYKTSIENMDVRHLERECSTCGDHPMDIVNMVYELKESLIYANN